jgi:hypothetical protein
MGSKVFVRIRIDRKIWADFRREAILKKRRVQELAEKAIGEFLEHSRQHEETAERDFSDNATR